MEQERRTEEKRTALVISSDELWCKFVHNTLRRTDRVLEASSLTEADELLGKSSFDVVFFSNELIPRNMAELESFISKCSGGKVVVVNDSPDEEMHLSPKHLSQAGVGVAEKPTESKALRRIVRHALFGE